MRVRATTMAACFLVGGSWCATVADGPLKTQETKYYKLMSNLSDEATREAKIRITLMAEEYFRRTKGFAGQINTKLPFLLFDNPRDYASNGGMPNTAGVFTGNRLLAWSDGRNPDWTWHVVQHEGFHQFAHYAIGGDIPIWANEGLAEYFGFGVWTGDSFRTGLIPKKQLAIVKKFIADNRFVTIEKMMKTDHEIWNTHVTLDPMQAGPNYVQAWSMVYFLAHAENGKYQRPFSNFLHAVSEKTAWEEAWLKNFGAGVADFEKRWKKYWTEQPDDPSRVEYADAATETLTSFYGRAVAQRQTFDDFAVFRKAAEGGTLKISAEDWLPNSLIERALKDIPADAEFTLRKKGGQGITVKLADGTAIEGHFKSNSNGKVTSVETTVREAKKKK